MAGFRQKLDEIFPQLPKNTHQYEGSGFMAPVAPQTYSALTSPDVIQCFEQLRDKVNAHIRYVDTVQKQEEAVSQPAPPEEKPTTGEAAGPKPPEKPEILSSPYIQGFIEDYFEEESGATADLPEMSPEALHFYNIIEKEIQDTEAMGNLVMSPLATLQRMKKAQQAFAQNRAGEALTVLKTAKREDPKNRGLSFVISQLYYYRVHQGHTEFLPEAREEGFKSSVQDDNLPFEKQIYYRYHSMASERPFSAERCLTMLREYYLLNPDVIEGLEGFAAHQNFHLYSWVVLSTIPAHLWSEFEIQSLISLVEKTVIGVPFYLHFFHPHVVQEQEKENELFNAFHELTQKINQSFMAYQNIVLPLQSQFNLQTKLPLHGPPLLWTVQNRYLKLFLEAAPMPEFDEVMLHISLNGRRFHEEVFPTQQVKSKGLTETSYWHTWAISLSCDEENRMDRIPIAQAVKEAPILNGFTQALEALMAEELAQLDFKKLEKAEKYFRPYALQDIRNYVEDTPTSTSFRYGPKAAYQKAYYRKWQQADHQFTKLFELINTIATAGAFADAAEIYTVMDLIEKHFLTHPENSPKARLEDAWQAHQEKEYGVKPSGKRKKGGDLDQALAEHFANAGWFYLFAIPTAGVTFIVVFAAGDMASAFKLVLGLGGVLGVGALIIYNNIKK